MQGPRGEQGQRRAGAFDATNEDTGGRRVVARRDGQQSYGAETGLKAGEKRRQRGRRVDEDRLAVGRTMGRGGLYPALEVAWSHVPGSCPLVGRRRAARGVEERRIGDDCLEMIAGETRRRTGLAGCRDI